MQSSPDRPSGRISAVLLAAGESKRMGQAKQLVAVQGEPMVVRAARVALETAIAELIVVTGAYREAVTEALQALQAQHPERLRFVHNPDFATGQASTIRTGVQALAPTQSAVLFLLVDQPFVSADLLQRLIDSWRQGALLAASAVDGEVRGAPAVFDRSLWPELLALQGDQGARPLFKRHAAAVVPVPTTAAELLDIDTPQTLQQITR